MPDNISSPDKKVHSPDYILLGIGIFLMLIPLGFLLMYPEAYEKAEFYLRVFIALGGGLVGASLPGLLDVKLPFAKAGGAMGVFLVLYAVNPPQITLNAIDTIDEQEISSPDKTVSATSVQKTIPKVAVKKAQVAKPNIMLAQNVLKVPVKAMIAVQAIEYAATPSTNGWVYLGTYSKNSWQAKLIEISNTVLPEVGKSYVVSTSYINVRSGKPSAPFYGMKEKVGRTNAGDRIKIVKLDSNLGKNRVWAKVEVYPKL